MHIAKIDVLSHFGRGESQLYCKSIVYIAFASSAISHFRHCMCVRFSLPSPGTWHISKLLVPRFSQMWEARQVLGRFLKWTHLSQVMFCSLILTDILSIPKIEVLQFTGYSKVLGVLLLMKWQRLRFSFSSEPSDSFCCLFAKLKQVWNYLR